MLSTLPTETIIQIFQNIDDYLTLTLALPLVCRRYRAIIDHATTSSSVGQLYGALQAFRDPGPPNFYFTYHPILDRLLVKTNEECAPFRLEDIYIRTFSDSLLFPQPDQDCIIYTTELSYKLTEAEEVCF